MFSAVWEKLSAVITESRPAPAPAPPPPEKGLMALPPDVLRMIVSYLGVLDRLALCRVCVQWNRIVTDEALWQPLFDERVAWSMSEYSAHSSSWRKAYVAWLREAVKHWRAAGMTKWRELCYPNEKSGQKTLKVLLFGDRGAGKSCVLRRMMGQPFEEEYEVTIGVEYTTVTCQPVDAKLELFSTPGERLTVPYFSLCQIFVFIYDGSVWLSPSALQLLKLACNSFDRRRHTLYVVRNKSDLPVHADNQGLLAAAMNDFVMAARLSHPVRALDPEPTRVRFGTAARKVFMDVSAKTGAGIEELTASLACSFIDTPRVLPGEAELLQRLGGGSWFSRVLR